MKITLIKIDNLKPAEYNPRQITNKQYEDLKASMEKFGCVDPQWKSCSPCNKQIMNNLKKVYEKSCKV